MVSRESPLPRWHVAEDLIVGAVFLDDVENVLDGRAGADGSTGTMLGSRGSLAATNKIVVVGRVFVDFLRELLQFGADVGDTGDFNAAFLKLS